MYDEISLFLLYSVKLFTSLDIFKQAYVGERMLADSLHIEWPATKMKQDWT